MEMNQSRSLDRILEAAVVASWADLMRGAQTGLVHIEYGFAPSGTLDFLQIWSTVGRGHWLLVCSCWMSASGFHQADIYFENGYKSEGLAHILESVMQHQEGFTLPQNLGRPGLLQIPTPKDEEGPAAAALVNEICEHFGSMAQPALARRQRSVQFGWNLTCAEAAPSSLVVPCTSLPLREKLVVAARVQ